MHFEESCFLCKSVDFLLFSCPKCSFKYCPSHRHFFNHGCQAQAQPQTNPQGHDDKKVSDTSGIQRNLIGKISCSYQGCPQVDILTSICSDCKLVFCLRHRLDVDHDCLLSTRKVAISHSLPAKSAGSSSGKVFKSRNPNPKLELMKLKLNAKGKGTIRMEDRAYFSVFLPNGKSEALFVNQSTQVGRLLDQIASSNGIENQNNKINPGEEKYLALYADASNQCLPMDATLAQLFESQMLYNGCSISLRRGGD
jgi:hypothetical protein